MIQNIYRIQAYSSIIFGYFCIGFIDFMLKGKKLQKIQKILELENIICFRKTLVLCIIFNKFENKDQKILKEEESIKIVKMIELKIYNYFKNNS